MPLIENVHALLSYVTALRVRLLSWSHKLCGCIFNCVSDGEWFQVVGASAFRGARPSLPTGESASVLYSANAWLDRNSDVRRRSFNFEFSKSKLRFCRQGG